MSTPRLLRFNDLRDRNIVTNWTTLCRWVRQGRFPPGRKVGPQTRVWTEDEINAWLEGADV
jgi:predicted DNA-binding transcriptional regulator AlpA